jgi:hypothetical protein
MKAKRSLGNHKSLPLDPALIRLLWIKKETALGDVALG